jgi:hypothetical protein
MPITAIRTQSQVEGEVSGARTTESNVAMTATAMEI